MLLLLLLTVHCFRTLYQVSPHHWSNYQQVSCHELYECKLIYLDWSLYSYFCCMFCEKFLRSWIGGKSDIVTSQVRLLTLRKHGQFCYQAHTFPKPDSPPCSIKSIGSVSLGSSASDESALTTGNIWSMSLICCRLSVLYWILVFKPHKYSGYCKCQML
jgi:hypothetical protein